MANSIVVIIIASTLACSFAANVTPIQKVITMMDAMLAKGKAMKHEEEVEFATSKEWCKSVQTQTTRTISQSASQIEQLSADIAKASADAEVLAGEIQDVEKETDANEASAKSALADRKKHRHAFSVTHLDLSESISDLTKAMNVVKAKGAPKSLMQLQSSRFIDDKAKEVLESLLAVHEKAGAPYEAPSEGVMDMLEKLKTKFEDEKHTLEKEERTSGFASESLMEQLKNDIKQGNDVISRKTTAKAAHLEEAAEAQGDLTVAQTSKATDEKTLADTVAECAAKSQEFERNQATRSAELKALSEAIAIMSQSNVKGTGATRLPAVLMQGTAFASLRSSVQEAPELRKKVVAYLQAQATKLDSRYLSVVASHAKLDPFAKIKKMVKGMVTKLQEEANSEADENGFCTTELATNKQTREIKLSEVADLTSQSDQASATSAKLSSDISSLADALTAIESKQSEGTNMRIAEKKTNADVVTEAKESQAAVSSAIKVLKDFYSPGDSASLMQDMSAGGKAPYTGMTASSGGILGLLDVVLSDFSRLETQTLEADDQAQRAHDTFMNESNEDAAVKETEKKHKENNRARTDEKLQTLKKELSMTEVETNTAAEYYEKLKAKCVDTGMSYNERKRMREEEIASLQESLKAIDGDEIA